MAVEAELGDLLDAAPPELRVGAALGDPEQELAGGALGVALPLRPERRPANRLLELAPRRVGRRDDVQAHRDVGAELRPGSAPRARA